MPLILADNGNVRQPCQGFMQMEHKMTKTHAWRSSIPKLFSPVPSQAVVMPSRSHPVSSNPELLMDGSMPCLALAVRDPTKLKSC